MTSFRLYLVIGSVLALTACGGGGSGSEHPMVVSDSNGSVSDAHDEGHGTTVLSGCEVDKYQAELLSRVNEARASARSCGNDNYAAAKPLTYSCRLEEASERHSVDMATNNFFSHTGSDGLRVSHRVTATGYEWSVVGENIAAGYSGPGPVMAAWLSSAGHCRNIMDPRFTEMAVTRIEASNADYDNYWTQVLAVPR